MANFTPFEIYLLRNQQKPLWLAGIDLSEAELFGAVLIGADLSSADLHGATLKFAISATPSYLGPT